MKFEEILSGGKPNSLGRTDEVVRAVLKDRTKLRQLFDTLASKDELVRLRVGDALEKVSREHPEWFKPFTERLLTTVSRIDQPSIQWHLAQIFGHMDLTPAQYRRAKAILKRNLKKSDDWIVLNVTMQQLFDWAKSDPSLRRWLTPELRRFKRNRHGSVAKRAVKLLSVDKRIS